MYQTIRFPQTETLSKGRNGFAYSCGICVSSFRDELMLETVGSRGHAGAARLVIPLSHINDLRKALDAFVAEHDGDGIEAAKVDA